MSTYEYNLNQTYLLTGILFSQLQGCFLQIKLQAQCLKLSGLLSINGYILFINIGFCI